MHAGQLGGDDDEIIFRVADSQGLSFRTGHFVMAFVEYEGRYGEEPKDAVLSVGADYYLRKTPVDCCALKHTFHASALWRYGRNLSPENITSKTMAGEEIEGIFTEASGNGAKIGGLKVTTKNGWFAARPSGTEDIYKIYAESFISGDHLEQIQQEAKEIVLAAIS